MFVIIIGFSVFTLGCLDNSVSGNSENDVVLDYNHSVVFDDIVVPESNKGIIHVTVRDNMLRYPAHVQVHKDGEFIQSVYMSEGEHTFSNIDYGVYSFVVSDPEYNMWWRDAFPHQDGYDNN